MDAPIQIKKHNFKKSNFNHPTWCVFSNAFIWGLDKSGYTCSDCFLLIGRQHITQAKKTVCIPHRGLAKNLHQADTSVLAKTRVFTVYLDGGYKKAVLLNPLEPLRVVLEKICASRNITLEEYSAEDMNGEELPLTILLGEIKGCEITFTSKGKTVSRTPPLIADLLREQKAAGKDDHHKVDVERDPASGLRVRSNVMDVYELGHDLGNGAFSVVTKARHKETNAVVAIKIIEKFETEDLPEQTQKIYKEVNLMRLLSHQHIIQFHHMEEDEECFYVIMEMVTGKELFDQVVAKQFYSEKEAAPVIAQALSAVAYIHSVGIVHRDIKPENLLFLDTTYKQVKLADFGEAKLYTTSPPITHSGTPDYMAPEIFNGGGETAYDQCCDMWSFGCVVYVMLGGYPPFSGQTEDEVIKSIVNCVYDFPSPEWDHVGDVGKDFIRKCFEVNPKARMTAVDGLNHPLITANVPEDDLCGLIKISKKADTKLEIRKNALTDLPPLSPKPVSTPPTEIRENRSEKRYHRKSSHNKEGGPRLNLNLSFLDFDNSPRESSGNLHAAVSSSPAEYVFTSNPLYSGLNTNAVGLVTKVQFSPRSSEIVDSVGSQPQPKKASSDALRKSASSDGKNYEAGKDKLNKVLPAGMASIEKRRDIKEPTTPTGEYSSRDNLHATNNANNANSATSANGSTDPGKDKTDGGRSRKEKGRSLSTSNKRPEGLLKKVIEKLGYDPLSTSPPPQDSTSAASSTAVPRRPTVSCPEAMDVPLDFPASPTSGDDHVGREDGANDNTHEKTGGTHESPSSSGKTRTSNSKKQSRSSSRDRDRSKNVAAKDELGSSGEKEKEKEIQFRETKESKEGKGDHLMNNRRSSSPIQSGRHSSHLRTSSPETSPARQRKEKGEKDRDHNTDESSGSPHSSTPSTHTGQTHLRHSGSNVIVKPKPRHRSKTVDAASGAKMLSEGDQEKFKRRRSIGKNVAQVLAGGVKRDSSSNLQFEMNDEQLGFDPSAKDKTGKRLSQKDKKKEVEKLQREEKRAKDSRSSDGGIMYEMRIKSDNIFHDYGDKTKKEGKVPKNRTKILVLGTGDVGKTTLMKQFWFMFDGEKKDKKSEAFQFRKDFTEIVKADSLRYIQDYLRTCEKFQRHLLDEIMNAGYLTFMLGRQIHALFSDFKYSDDSASAVNNINSASSLCYFIQNILRIADEQYVPTASDVLRVYRSTREGTNHFSVSDAAPLSDLKHLTFVDIGGRRDQRKKWPHEMIGVNLIVYLVAMDEYDLTLDEDPEANRLIESLKLWKFILTRDYLVDVPMLLVFTKCDLMREKLRRVPFNTVFANFNEFVTQSESCQQPQVTDYEKACQYLCAQFHDIFAETKAALSATNNNGNAASSASGSSVANSNSANNNSSSNNAGNTAKNFNFTILSLTESGCGKELLKVVQSALRGEPAHAGQKKSNKS